MQHLGQWLAGERAEILDRRAAIGEQFPRLAAKGWHLEGCGAYFAYLRHPYDLRSDVLAPLLVQKAGVLGLPATFFMPEGGGGQHLRIAFANVDRAGIAELFDRLEAFTPTA
jgi:aspartate/methionine/tyrosine aminotransferase